MSEKKKEENEMNNEIESHVCLKRTIVNEYDVINR